MVESPEQNSVPIRVAVLGGGISGIAAAWYLSHAEQMELDRAAPEVELKLFEVTDRLGGVLETVHDGKYLVERSADNFATLIPDAMELSKKAGLADQLIHPNEHGRQAFVLSKGRLQPIPAGFSLMQPTRVGSILATPTLSLKAKLRLAAELLVPARKDLSDESLESFATRRLGRETFEALVEPIVSGIFTADPATLSMSATMPQFVAMERKYGGLIRGHLALRKRDAAAAARKASGARYDQFVAPQAGMSHWIDQLARQLPADSVQLNTPVTRAQPIVESPIRGPRWRLSFRDQPDQEFDAVVSCLPTQAMAKLLESSEAEGLATAGSLIGSVEYASSAVVAMIVKRSELASRTDGFGLIVPRKEQRNCLAISYTSNKYPSRVPDDQLLLRVFMGGALRPELVDAPDNQLLALAEREVRDILGWIGGKAQWQALIRWTKAMPQYTLGHVERVANIRFQLAKFPGIHICGAGYDGVGIPQCVRGAKRAVTEILTERL